MTKTEVLEALRGCNEETCYEALRQAVDFAFPPAAPPTRPALIHAMLGVVDLARRMRQPALLLGVAAMLVPEGWLLRSLKVDGDGKGGECWFATLFSHAGWADIDNENARWRVIGSHPIAAVALAITAVEAMPDE